MFERIIILGFVLTLLTILVKKISYTKIILNKNLPDNLDIPDSELPTVLYFWTEQCVQCKSSQKPALQRLQRNRGRFNLVDINAFEKEDIVSSFKIRTVPSTVIISRDKKPVFVNNGFRSEKELIEQLNKIS